jgi:hypothetical protein
MSILPIDSNFTENREINIKLLFHKFLDLNLAFILLTKKLVTRKSQNLKTSISELIVNFNHAFIAFRS